MGKTILIRRVSSRGKAFSYTRKAMNRVVRKPGDIVRSRYFVKWLRGEIGIRELSRAVIGKYNAQHVAYIVCKAASSHRRVLLTGK